MKFAFLLFGALGFFLVVITGYSADRAIDLVLRDAAIGCLVSALVGRWFWSVIERAFAETLKIRREAEAAAEQAAAENESAAKSVPSGAAAVSVPVKSPSTRPATAKAPALASR